MGLGKFRETLLKVLESFHTMKIDFINRRSREVEMRILKAGNHQASLKIKNGGVRGSQGSNLLIAADRKNLVAAYGQRLRLRPHIILGPDFPV